MNILSFFLDIQRQMGRIDVCPEPRSDSNVRRRQFDLVLRRYQREGFCTVSREGRYEPKATYVILSTLQMVPVLKKKSDTIMNAQRARGVETEAAL